ncbi:MAG: NifB/NifX family molybdenum-iron cluster-binding protein [Anaerolineae bacterium]|nr:NifB/NifX family molybdenum-iron cluster-binding protein [Anaerolineae bacterium]
MKIILTTTEPNITAEIDPRFGRGTHFIIVDTDTLEWEAHANPGVNASGGAGVQAAQFASEQGVQAAISGGFGPNAYDSLNAAGITMYLCGTCRTAQEAVERFKAGELEQPAAPGGGGRGRRR